MSNNTVAPGGAAPSLRARADRRFTLLGALGSALALEIVARIAPGVDAGPAMLPELLSLAAVTLACGSIIALAIHASGSRVVALLMLLGTGAFSYSVLLHLFARTPAGAAFLTDSMPYYRLTVSLADITGIGAWMFGFFWLVFELQDTKTRLEQQQDRLISEIADRENAERLIRESESHFRSVFDRVGVGILILTPGGVIIECNRAVGAELGYTDRQLQGTALLTLVHEKDRANICTELEQLGSGASESRQFEHRVICRDESLLWYSTTATVIRFDSDKPGIIVALMENISARRLRGQQVQQRQKMESLGILAGGIAHDFNNLLVGVMANAELLSETASGPAETGACNDIVQSAHNAATLCHQLLAYAGKAPKVEQALSLTDLVLNSEELLRAALGRQAVLELVCAPVLPPIKADPSLIRQVLFSLISNAADALEGKGGSVQIGTGVASLGLTDFENLIHDNAAEPGTYVFLAITDAGAGMDEHALPKVFDPFYTTKQLGTGLGLAAVAGIVRAHAGMISIQSRVGAGTTIRIYFPPTTGDAKPVQPDMNAPFATPLPAVPPARPSEKPSTPMPQQRPTGTVLVVDDEDKVRDAARRVLEHYGYVVLTAIDGQDGIEVFEAHHHELTAVLLDLTMPRMNGETAFRKMHQLNPAVPVILSSGYSEGEGSSAGLVGEVAGYIRKPYRINQLLDKLREVT